MSPMVSNYPIVWHSLGLWDQDKLVMLHVSWVLDQLSDSLMCTILSLKSNIAMSYVLTTLFILLLTQSPFPNMLFFPECWYCQPVYSLMYV